MDKIVVVSHNRPFFGAQIVHVPLLKYLKEKYPDSEVYYFSKYESSAALLPLKLIDFLVVEKSKLNFAVQYKKINPTLTVSLRKSALFHSLVIALFAKGEKIGFSNRFTRIFFDRVVESKVGIYRANNYLSLFNQQLKTQDRVQSKKNRVCLIPGAGQSFKIWDFENYLKLAAQIKKRRPDYEIVFILGEAERDCALKLSEFTCHIELDIAALFACVEESKLVVANDCGPSHIAHVSGTSIISIFSDEYENAQTTIKEWFHLKEGSHAMSGLAKQSINTVSVEDVLSTALAEL